MEPPTTSSPPMAVRRGPFVAEPRPDPRAVMDSIERQVRELAIDSNEGPMSMRGHALACALRDVPLSSGIRRRH